MINWKNIIVHHSWTADRQALDIQAIRRYHTSWAFEGNIVLEKDARALIADGKTVKYPWDDIGYHRISEKVNGVAEVIMGRPLTMQGAHTKGRNHDSIGWCIIGNYDEAPPPVDLWIKTVKGIYELVKVFDIPIQNIKGHRDFAEKSCPGLMFDVQKLIDDVATAAIGGVRELHS